MIAIWGLGCFCKAAAAHSLQFPVPMVAGADQLLLLVTATGNIETTSNCVIQCRGRNTDPTGYNVQIQEENASRVAKAAHASNKP